MENYGSDLFLSQEAYPSIDFTLLDRPSGSIASAPEATASLLPDSSFPSFDFLDAPGVGSFNEASFRENGRFRREDYGQSNPITNTGRSGVEGSGTELPSSRFQLPFEMQRPISNVDFFSTKESGNSGLQSRLPPSQNEVPDGVHEFFELDHMSQQQQQPGAGSWSLLVNTWADADGDSQLLYHEPDALTDRIQIPLKPDNLGAHTMLDHSETDLSSSQMLSTDQGPTSLQSLLPTSRDPDDSDVKSSQMGMGFANPQEATFSSRVIKSQPLNMEGLSNGLTPVQSKPSHVILMDNILPEQHSLNASNATGKEGNLDHFQYQNGRFSGQNLEGLMHAGTPLSYDFLGGQLYLKGQGHGSLGQHSGGAGRELGFTDMQLWQQQQFLYSQQLQELHRQQQTNNLNQHPQLSRQQQLQQFLAGQNHLAGNPYTSLLFGNSLHDPSQAVRSNSGLNPAILENYSAAFVPGNFANANPGVSGWSLNGSSSMQGSISDAPPMGYGQNLGWQALLLKGSQLDPSLYGSLMASSRDVAGHRVAFYPGSQNALADVYNAAARLSTSTQVGKPVPRSLPSGSPFVGDAQMDYFTPSNSQNSAAQDNAVSIRHQVCGKPLPGQNVQQPSTQTTEQNQVAGRLHQLNSAFRSQQQFQDFHGHQQQRVWNVSGQNEDADLQNISQQFGTAETLSQSFMSNQNLQQSNWQSVAPRQPVSSPDARSPRVDSGHFQHRDSYQSGNSQILPSSTPNQQNDWSMHQVGASANHSIDDGQQQQDSWCSLPSRQNQNDTGNGFHLVPNSKHNIWSGHPPSSSLGGASFHLFNGLDRRQLKVPDVPHPQQEIPKVGIALPGSLGGNSSQVSQKPPHPYVERERQDGEWKGHNVQNCTQTGKAVRSLANAVDGTAGSWRDQIIHQSAGGTDFSLQPPNVDTGLSGNVWAHNLQQGNSEVEMYKVTTCASNELHNSSNQDAQARQQSRNMLLMNVDTGQQNNTQNEHLYSKNQQTAKYKLIGEYGRKFKNQGNVHVGYIKGETRQGNNQYVSGNQSDTRMGTTFRIASNRLEDSLLHEDGAQVWGSPATKIKTREVNTFNRNGAPQDPQDTSSSQVGHLDARHQSARSDCGSHSNSPPTERGSHLQSLANSGLHMQSRLRQVNMDQFENLTEESSASKLSHLVASSASQPWQLHSKKLFTSGEMPDLDIQKTGALNEAIVGQAERHEVHLQHSSSLNTGEDLPFSNSQVNFTPSRETTFFKRFSTTDTSTTVQTVDRVETPPLFRPGQLSQNHSSQRSGEEQYILQEKRGVTSSNISSVQYKHNQSSSPLLSKSIGPGLAPPSYLSKILQQGCSSNFGNFLHSQKGQSRPVGSTVASKNHEAQPDYAGHGLKVERTDVRHEGSNAIGIVSPNPCVTSGLNSDHTRSTFDSGQPFFLASGKDVQDATATYMVMSPQNAKVAGLSQRESGVVENFIPPVSLLNQVAAERGPLPREISSLDHTGHTMHQLHETQGAQFSKMLTNLQNSLSGQHRLPVGHEKHFPGVFESFRPPAVANSGITVQFQPNSQLDVGTSNNVATISVGGQSQLFQPVTESHVSLDDGSKYAITQQQKSPIINSGKSVLNSSFHQAHVQELRRPLPGKLSASAFQSSSVSALQVSGPSLGQEQLQVPSSPNQSSPLKLSASGPRDSQPQEAKSLSSDRFSNYPFSHGRSLQPTDTSSEGLSVSQTSESLSHSDTQGAHASEPMAMERRKQGVARKKPPKHNTRPGSTSKNKLKGKSSQQPVHLPSHSTQSKVYAGQEQVCSMSESPLKAIQGPLQETDKLPHMHNRLQNQAVTNYLDGVLQNPEAMPHGQHHTEASCAFPHSESSANEQVLTSQAASIHENVTGIGRVQVVGPQQLVGKTLDTSYIGHQPSRYSGGLSEAFLKEGESRLPARTTTVTLDQSGQHEFSTLKPSFHPSFHPPVIHPPRKRKQLVPPLIPWHIAMTKPASQFLSTSGADFFWAASTNRLREKDDEDADTHDEGTMSIARAKRRLKLTTQLLQQLVPPLPPALLQGNTAIDYECAAYTVAKRALGDACQLVAKSGKESDPLLPKHRDQTMSLEAPGNSLAAKNSALVRLLGGFMDNFKRLDNELTSLEGSTSALELKNVLHAGETLSIVNRLAKHHGRRFPLESSENCYVEKEFPSDSGPGIRRPLPQKYVTAVPMPRTLPEGVICLSL